MLYRQFRLQRYDFFFILPNSLTFKIYPPPCNILIFINLQPNKLLFHSEKNIFTIQKSDYLTKNNNNYLK